MADRYAAGLLVLQVVAPEHAIATTAGGAPSADELRRSVQAVAGGRGRALLECHSDPAETIVRVAEEERADVVVVGNRGMRERTEFLLGSVPNRVSHAARCHVVLVNTAPHGSGAAGPDAARSAVGRSEEH